MLENLITVKEAAELCGIPELRILNWINKHKIAASWLGNVWWIDKTDLQFILDSKKKIANRSKYLRSILDEKNEEIDAIISQMDDYLFLLKSIKKNSFAFRVITTEMATLIPDETRRNIFIAVSSGNQVAVIANEYGISADRVYHQFDKALVGISKKVGFLVQYRSTLAEKEFRIRELESLLKDKKVSDRLSGRDTIPTAHLYLLSAKLEIFLNMETRTKNCMRSESIFTIEDLLRYVKDDGFTKLYNIRLFGKKSMRVFKAELRRKEIIDDLDRSFLFKYL